MKLFMESILSSASTHDSTADDETPCSSGVLRDSGAAKVIEEMPMTSSNIENTFTPDLQKIRRPLCLDKG
jgi:hypothetical protein